MDVDEEIADLSQPKVHGRGRIVILLLFLLILVKAAWYEHARLLEGESVVVVGGKGECVAVAAVIAVQKSLKVVARSRGLQEDGRNGHGGAYRGERGALS